MNPSIDVRLSTMIRAMADVVIPALSETPGLASEQAQLVLGHLHVLRQQVDHAGRFEELEYRAALSLGEALVAGAGEGSSSSPAWQRLEAALAADVGARPADTRNGGEAIRGAVEALLREGAGGGSDDEARLRAIVLQHERTAADLNRTWFAAMGWESPDHGLPSIPEVADEGLAALAGR
jgi:hypothetical protein